MIRRALCETQFDGYSIISTPGGLSAIARGEDVGPLFLCDTDAHDWAEDTGLGLIMPEGYDVKPLRGSTARLMLALIARARSERNEAAQ